MFRDKNSFMDNHQKIKTYLKSLPNFSEVSADAFDWIVDKGYLTYHKKGDFLFQVGDSVDELTICLEGVADVYREKPDGRQGLFLMQKGTITGNLPFSRVKVATATAKVVEDLTIFNLHKKYFIEMVNVSYELTQAFVAVMSDRIRDTSQNQFQDEKLKALGKISAGLAHELNNPASAMVRSAEVLYDKLSETPENFKAVMRLNITEEQTDFGNNLIFKKIELHKKSPKDFTLLEREDRLDELLDWLEDHEVQHAEDIAETLTDFDFEESDLYILLESIKEKDKLSTILTWFDNRLSVESLVVEIKEASSRVANLVQSVKKYSHMDEGRGKTQVDIHDGLRTTLAILGHLFKEKGIIIDKQFSKEFPKIEANPGELNQVWTNLISNAVDAVDKGGKLTLQSFINGDYLVVKIIDNGKGIPADIINRIWEPFFTTKGVGEGTGMGLDIVKKIIERHRGSINVDTQPGETVFTIKFLK